MSRPDKTKTVLTYSDGRTADFDSSPGNDPLELDLDGNQDVFSIVVYAGDRIIFSAYRWHNEPANNE